MKSDRNYIEYIIINNNHTMHEIINILNQTKKILTNKYSKMRIAQSKSSIYQIYLSVQKLWVDAPIKKLARLQEFINDNQEYL